MDVVAARLVFNMGKPGVVGIEKRIRGKKDKIRAKIFAGEQTKTGKVKAKAVLVRLLSA